MCWWQTLPLLKRTFGRLGVSFFETLKAISEEVESGGMLWIPRAKIPENDPRYS